MRKLHIIAAIVALPFLLAAQSSRIFSDKKTTPTTEGGSFTVQCSQSYAMSCYQDYMRSFKTKKISKNELVTDALGGTVKAVFGVGRTEVSVDVVVTDAAFPSLAFNLKNYIDAELLRDTFRQQKRILDGLVSRKAATEKDNVNLERKIERLRIDIANAETKIILNNGAIIKYTANINQQKGLVDNIQSQIDDLLQALPTK